MKKRKIIEGKTYYPSPSELTFSDNSVKGNRWIVVEDSGSYYFEYDAGRLCDDFKRISISEEDYCGIRTGVIGQEDLVKKYEL